MSAACLHSRDHHDQRRNKNDEPSIHDPWGQWPIDFAAVVRKLEAAGYQGFYVAEYIEGFNALDPVAESRKFLEWLQKL